MPLTAPVPSSGPLNLAPRLYVVPAELAPFKDLFLRFGAHGEFSVAQFCGFLADLAATSGGESLSAQELDQALAVTQVGSPPLMPFFKLVSFQVYC